MKRCVGLLLAALAPLLSQSLDPRLDAIRKELALIRTEGPQHDDTRGASVRFTTVKHQLRDWVEAHLAAEPLADVARLGTDLNRELEQAGLIETGGEDDGTWLGSLGSIEVKNVTLGYYVTVVTAVGIECGFDESAYVYRLRSGHWVRIFQSEQNTYTKDGYSPQSIFAVHVSPAFDDKEAPYVLTLGREPWCSSSFHDVYFRLWNTRPDGSEPRLLVDRGVFAYMGRHEIPIQGSVGRSDALVEFTTNSMDVTVHSRPSVWHYKLAGDTAKRIDPIALSPSDFLEEWLNGSWSEMRNRTEATGRMALKQVHSKLHKGDIVLADFIDTAKRCKGTRDLSQVGVTKDGRDYYFLVRWSAPYHFTMARALDHASPACTIPDNESLLPGTLFPTQDWRE